MRVCGTCTGRARSSTIRAVTPCFLAHLEALQRSEGSKGILRIDDKAVAGQVKRCQTREASQAGRCCIKRRASQGEVQQPCKGRTETLLSQSFKKESDEWVPASTITEQHNKRPPIRRQGMLYRFRIQM